MTQNLDRACDVLDFWFFEAGPKQWFRKNREFDQILAERFGALHYAACRCELFAWRDSSRGALAEILLLDQFSRNIYRDQARAFGQDSLALIVAQHLVAQGGDKDLPSEQRAFAYMPYMHSESPVIHREALRLFDQPGLERNLYHEQRHLAIIERFGRYPHRNAVLGRESTEEELAFLRESGSSF